MGNNHLGKTLPLVSTFLKICLGLSGELRCCSPTADSIVCLGNDR